MFNFIKQYFRKKCIKTASLKSSKREVIAHNFETTKTMGIILPFRSDMDDVTNRLKNIARNNNIELTFVIYFPQDKLPETAVSTPERIVFSNKECNWYGKPGNQQINDFIKYKYDILIDLSSETWFPLQYISLFSNASFKIGRINEENNPYDFLLVGSGSEEQFVKDLESYLHKIK